MALTRLQKLSITSKHRGDWYRALGKTADDSLPMFEVLTRMEAEFAKIAHPLAPLVKDLLWRLKGGGTASRASSGRRTLGTELRGLVPDAEAMMIQAGVLSGNMSAGLFNAAGLVNTQGKLKGAVVGALLKPGGYLAALIGLLIFFSVNLLPKFERGRPRTNWPSEAVVLGFVADHIALIAGGLVGILICAGVGLAWLAPNWIGSKREWCDRNIFPFTMIASLAGASLLTSLAGYIGAGTPINEAVTNIRDAASPYMKSQCERLLALMRDGVRAEDALARLSVVQPRYHWIIKVYGLSGDASAAYKTIATEMTNRTQDFIKVLFDRVVSNVLLVLVGMALMWIYLSMFGIADSGTKTAALASGLSIAAFNQPQGATHV